MVVRGMDPSESAHAAEANPPPILPALPSLEALLVSPGDGLFLFSPDLDYLYVNPAGAAMTGHAPD